MTRRIFVTSVAAAQAQFGFLVMTRYSRQQKAGYVPTYAQSHHASDWGVLPINATNASERGACGSRSTAPFRSLAVSRRLDRSDKPKDIVSALLSKRSTLARLRLWEGSKTADFRGKGNQAGAAKSSDITMTWKFYLDAGFSLTMVRSIWFVSRRNWLTQLALNWVSTGLLCETWSFLRPAGSPNSPSSHIWIVSICLGRLHSPPGAASYMLVSSGPFHVS